MLKNVLKTGGKVVLILLALGVFAGVISGGAIMASRFYNGTAKTIDFPQKSSSAELGSSENPYVILEVVPDAAMGTLGYLVEGQEPVGAEGMQRLALASSASGSAVELYKDLFTGETGIADMSSSLVNRFWSDADVKAKGLWVEYNNEPDPSLPAEQKLRHGEYGYFENVGEGNGSYNFITDPETGTSYFGLDEKGKFRWVRVATYDQKLSGYLDPAYYYKEKGFTETNIQNGYEAFEASSYYN